MLFRSVLVTAPTIEPVSRAEAKLHAHIDTAAEDDRIALLITAVRMLAERYTGRAFITQTWDFYLNAFPSSIDPLELPMGNLQSITSVKYYDPDNALQTWPSIDYQLDIVSVPGLVLPVAGGSWLSTYDRFNAVTIRAVVGYGATAASVPEPIRLAIMTAVADLYQHRENAGELGGECRALLDYYKLDWV